MEYIAPDKIEILEFPKKYAAMAVVTNELLWRVTLESTTVKSKK